LRLKGTENTIAAMETTSLQEAEMVPKVGQPAPDFSLKSHDDREVRLSDYRGQKNVVIAFFPLAWTPV
jgi:peroxiredoxin